jgi:hypothetical protein
MSADAFYAFYGIRRLVNSDDESAINQLELRKHPIQTAARSHGLEVWWGNCAAGDHHYVLVGKMIAKLGVENQSSARVEDAALKSVAGEVTAKLLAAGFEESPGMLFELELG